MIVWERLGVKPQKTDSKYIPALSYGHMENKN
jgi:hypothetical protein